jgi:hypothetical protein
MERDITYVRSVREHGAGNGLVRLLGIVFVLGVAGGVTFGHLSNLVM